MKVLAIESTCDETAAAVVESFGGGVRVISNVVASSVEMQKKYGGIVPEVAAREQIKSIIPVITEAIKGEEIDAVAVSYGPGLMGSLLIGVETAKVLAWAWKKPLLKVNHMAAHVMANWIVGEKTQELKNSRTQDIENFYDIPHLPAVGLVVSGGHTDLILLESLLKWTWIGGTRDDAAGEAFDKTARLLGLPYPGGPEVDKAASKVTEEEWNLNKNKFKLPRPLLHDPGLEMSFSGIKAAVARMVENRSQILDNSSQMTVVSYTNLVAREFSEAVTEVLVKKTMAAVEKFKPKDVILAGGVAANKMLRELLKVAVENAGLKFYVPELKYCGDNAAMVGAAAILRPEGSELDLRPEPSLGVV
ncbi:MAG: putative tRNA threonylcarbamoyladenosine biosynthesis protein Gcp [Candidatus Collierbacteria bacterium GW2011_GWB1_45_35]|uniref:tRNA N6-adenosine threonylcarbamoyltransferase n=1 Tax=Candidatus Collierbacteria bacterium GW2011_GWB2_45_17 TaxID=1618388 RepID=A0A837ILV6_9BACT|nr:MAG: putative tRNA threonylcarbamoyladenosine biosynthesis protein Gcp [Microgenomates group bacterium GW2011_GWC1_44_23]KKT96041.1 MAG: putative tRNA threonylcarbamoyladenosine biosynthesis protein Gcp [Candidatus Collierbacteria bacterium GW2011_GWA1_45_15]KKU01085.1 MAG: putative tRNA threonylcarbamoyladenosine biosynthesis protein Gcp [Candidatus Collierbacteria bacterium GW2011_GWB2_45_17]KKU05695.1 MAG: putative tRNA threonylcarbamoyladenosine biosynthesis protein Gcp [Candidatus Collie